MTSNDIYVLVAREVRCLKVILKKKAVIEQCLRQTVPHSSSTTNERMSSVGG